MLKPLEACDILAHRLNVLEGRLGLVEFVAYIPGTSRVNPSKVPVLIRITQINAIQAVKDGKMTTITVRDKDILVIESYEEVVQQIDRVLNTHYEGE